MGKWNEVARLPNLIEKNLRNLTEEYSLNEDGTIKVLTRAFNAEKNKRLRLQERSNLNGCRNAWSIGSCLFLPIFLDYNILDIDDDYKYALVSGSGFSYLWLLSRENSMPEEMKQRFMQKAALLGFDINKLEWVDY